MTSSLYRELADYELKILVSKSLKTEILSAYLLTGGLFNTTYLIETLKYGKTVLRVGPVNGHLLMPFEHHLMEAEEYVYTLCSAYKVPVSEILATDTSKKLIDRDYMFVRYIPSCPMSQIELSSENRARIVREIGRATAKFHSIEAPRFGRIVDVKNGGGFTLWSDALLNELYEWERVGIPAAIFTKNEYDTIRMLFEKAKSYLDEIKHPHLVHADLWLGNILIRTDMGHPEFAAIIDADRALWGDPAFEFSSIQWTYGEECFWEGYGRLLSHDIADRIRRSIYTLLNRLWNAYVYLVEYNQPEQADKEAIDARLQIAYLQSMLDAPENNDYERLSEVNKNEISDQTRAGTVCSGYNIGGCEF